MPFHPLFFLGKAEKEKASERNTRLQKSDIIHKVKAIAINQ